MAAGISQSSVSRIERGHLGTLPWEAVLAVANVLEVRLEFTARWRGGDLERVVNRRHSALHEGLARRISEAGGWESVAEVSFAIYGERGVIDRLAFHRNRRALAIFEIKPDLADPAGLIGQTDRYRRLAVMIAGDRGWRPDTVSCWAIVGATDTNRRRLVAHQHLLREAFPAHTPALRRWLLDPDRRLDGLAFVAYPYDVTGTGAMRSPKRVRRPRDGRPERGPGVGRAS